MLLSLSARSSRKKGAVGKSADRITLSVLLEWLFVPSLHRGEWRKPNSPPHRQSAVNVSTHYQSTILPNFLPCFLLAFGNHLKHSLENVLRPYSVNSLLHILKIRPLIICVPLALHWITCGG
ncbi:hypothetical protein HMPREF1553_02334 [Porphyromonas gingivalis F0568]|nr:hypothetical protein HMPREF1553_02334 [Porphyromonas gingivalis F0568]